MYMNASETCWNEEDECKICGHLCETAHEKAEHERSESHAKKKSIKDFCEEAVECSGESAICRRHQYLNRSTFGLEVIEEILISSKIYENLWACRICWKAGYSNAQLDAHLMNDLHILEYLQRFHPNDELECFDRTRGRYDWEMLRQKFNKMAEEYEEVSSPRVIRMIGCPKETVLERLSISVNIEEHYKVFNRYPEDNRRKILRCLTCSQMIASNARVMARVCSTHEESEHHRACAHVKNILDRFDMRPRRWDEPLPIKLNGTPRYKWKWTRSSRSYHGPICGLAHVVEAAGKYICTLCNCGMKDLQHHFSSPAHISKHLSWTYGPEIFRLLHVNGKAQRDRMMELLIGADLNNNGQGRIAIGVKPLPLDLKAALASTSNFRLGTDMPFLQSYAGVPNCLYCSCCNKLMKVRPNEDCGLSVWDEHFSTTAHFDSMALKAQFSFDKDGFVDDRDSSIIKEPTDDPGVWKVVEPIENVEIMIQTYRNIGLEFMVEDEVNDEVVCTLCWRNYSRINHRHINIHIRSLSHAMKYIHASEKGSGLRIETGDYEGEVQDYILNVLRRCPLDRNIRVYNKELAREIKVLKDKQADIMRQLAELNKPDKEEGELSDDEELKVTKERKRKRLEGQENSNLVTKNNKLFIGLKDLEDELEDSISASTSAHESEEIVTKLTEPLAQLNMEQASEVMEQSVAETESSQKEDDSSNRNENTDERDIYEVWANIKGNLQVDAQQQHEQPATHRMPTSRPQPVCQAEVPKQQRSAQQNMTPVLPSKAAEQNQQRSIEGLNSGNLINQPQQTHQAAMSTDRQRATAVLTPNLPPATNLTSKKPLPKYGIAASQQAMCSTAPPPTKVDRTKPIKGQKMFLPREYLPNGMVPDEPPRKTPILEKNAATMEECTQSSNQMSTSHQHQQTTQQTSTAAASSYDNTSIQPIVPQPTAAQNYQQQYNNAPFHPNQYSPMEVSAYQQYQQATNAQANPAPVGYYYPVVQQPPPPPVYSPILQPMATQHYQQQYNNAPMYQNQYLPIEVSTYQQYQQAANAQADPAPYGYYYLEVQQPPPQVHQPAQQIQQPPQQVQQPPPPGVDPAEYPESLRKQYFGGQ